MYWEVHVFDWEVPVSDRGVPALIQKRTFFASESFLRKEELLVVYYLFEGDRREQ